MITKSKHASTLFIQNKKIKIGHQILCQTGANWIYWICFEKRRNTELFKELQFKWWSQWPSWLANWLLAWCWPASINVVYWMKKTCDNLRRPPVSCQAKPPKILTDQYWPIKNSILKHLSIEDLLSLKNAYPSIQLQMWEEKERARVKFVQEVIEFQPKGWGCSSILSLLVVFYWK